jgi:23S rRNA (uracil1939-C5)-methyltransferase
MDEPRVEELSIDSLGDHGEGLARSAYGPLVIPGALPGERVLARIDGARGRLIDILAPSPDRIAPICTYFGD